MTARPGGPVEVLSGRAGPDLRWVVVAEGDDEDLITMLDIYRDDRQVAGSGFRGQGLHGDSLINEWRGQTDDLPYFVMARVSPVVDRVVATTDRGSQIALSLSPVIDQFALRFAAGAIPPGEQPASLRIERDGTVLESLWQPMPPRRR
jgi:hypothetical protein